MLLLCGRKFGRRIFAARILRVAAATILLAACVGLLAACAGPTSMSRSGDGASAVVDASPAQVYVDPGPSRPALADEAIARLAVAPVGAGGDTELHVRIIDLGTDGRRELTKSGEISFARPTQPLGVSIALTEAAFRAAERLQPVNEIRLIVTGYDARGESVGSVRAIPARATFRGVEREEGWFWVDLSLLPAVTTLSARVVISRHRPPGGMVAGASEEGPLPRAAEAPLYVGTLAVAEEPLESTHEFTIALIPDTQKYAESYPETFTAQTEYLAAAVEPERIAFVSHLGDVVEHGERESEWRIADAAMSVLDGVVPYGIVIGNHDFADEFEDPHGGAPLFLQYFPESRYAELPWHGGRSPDGLSSYQLIDAGPWELLYLHLSVDTPPAALEWARRVIARYPGRPTIVTTHVYLRENGRIPKPYLWGSGDGTWDGISSEQFFTDFVARHPQIFMVTCGHISSERYQVSINDTGLPVFELLQDYQNREAGGEGFLRFLRFYPDRDEIRAVTYSPTLDQFEVDGDSHFVIEIDFDTRFDALSE